MTRTLTRTLLVTLGPVLFAANSMAAEAVPDSVSPKTLDDYLQLARSANAGLQAASYRALAARERAGVEGSMPDPTFIYGNYVAADDGPAHDPPMKGRQELILMQEIPFFGKRGLRSDVASLDADAIQHEARTAMLEVEMEVKRAFYSYVNHAELARVIHEEAAVLERMREVVQVRYGSGLAEQQDVLKIELVRAQLDNELAWHHRELGMERARLNELIGRGATSPLPDPVWSVPAFDVARAEALADSAVARRPEVAAAARSVESAEASRRLAKREFIPDFMLGAKYEFGGGSHELGEEMGDWWEVMAGVNLPLWFGKRNAMEREATALRTSAEYRVRAETLRTEREVEEATLHVQAAQERVGNFETHILPRARQTLESSEAGYRAGRVEFLDYLDSQRTLLALRKEYYEMVMDLGMQIAMLERALGVTSVMHP
jgi:outer membrane protein TolC